MWGFNNTNTRPVIAPYIFSWGHGNDDCYRTNRLEHVYNSGIRHIIIGFLTWGNKHFEEIQSWKPDIDRYRGRINVILSIGGATGTFPHPKIDECTQSQKVIQLMKELGISELDFDIEGKTLENVVLVKKWARIAQLISKEVDNLKVSLTLPVEFYGLGSDAIRAIKIFLEHGINPVCICFMTMDFYTPLDLSSWGQKHIQILTKSHQCLSVLFEKRNLWDKLGICPMLGVNDDKTVFSLSDWQNVLHYTKEKNIGRISFWAINRDQAGENSIDISSNAQNRDLEYTDLALQTFRY